MTKRGRPSRAYDVSRRRGTSVVACLAAWGLGAACAGEIVSDEGGEPDAGGPGPDAGTAPEDCHAWLEARDVAFSPGSESPGVEDPIVVTPPIEGIHYRVSWEDSRRDSMFMDCELGRSLVRAAPSFRERDIVEVADMGIYNYRCIGGGDPDEGCPNGISQHAYAKAIDIAGVTTEDGSYASVEDDWIIDPEGVPTCDADTEGDKDALLHELICELKAKDVWTIVLTPNYNEAHRDHFHVDLSEDADFIEWWGRGGVDVGGPAH